MPTRDWMRAIHGSSLSQATKDNYESRKRTLERTMNTTISNILRNPDTYGKKIQDTWKEPKTHMGMIALILSIYKHNPSKVKRKAEARWREIMDPVMKGLEERRKTNEPTDRQKKGYVPFDEIAEKRTRYPVGSDERLILAMYSLRPPARGDYNALRIYTEDPGENPGDPNYIVLEGNPRLVLNEYKTAKRYGRYEETLPDALVEEIADSLIERPRDYLFGKRSANTYVKWCNRMLSRMFERPLTIGLIRHAAINKMDMNKNTTKEKEEMARQMMHNLRQQELYRLDVKGK
jgi:hypothetical protein